MPAYSFTERFIPFILNCEKRQTIRKKRKGQAKKGSTLYLYYAMRTKYCKKLKEAICIGVKEIRINPNGDVFVGFKKLTQDQKDWLAFRDGFRSGKAYAEGCFEVMFRFWSQTHDLPFTGDIIYW